MLLLSCSIIPREAWRTSVKTKSVGFKKSLNIDVETYMKGIAYFTVGNLQDFTNYCLIEISESWHASTFAIYAFVVKI